MSTNSLIEPLSTPTTGKPAILVLNGPDLVQVDQHEAEIYESTSLIPYLEQLANATITVTIAIHYPYCKGALVGYLYMAWELGYQAVVLNAEDYTHTSIATTDTIRATPLSVIGVHTSQPLVRETYRHTLLIAPYYRDSTAGFGMANYDLAVRVALRPSRWHSMLYRLWTQSWGFIPSSIAPSGIPY